MLSLALLAGVTIEVSGLIALVPNDSGRKIDLVFLDGHYRIDRTSGSGLDLPAPSGPSEGTHHLPHYPTVAVTVDLRSGGTECVGPRCVLYDGNWVVDLRDTNVTLKGGHSDPPSLADARLLTTTDVCPHTGPLESYEPGEKGVSSVLRGFTGRFKNAWHVSMRDHADKRIRRAAVVRFKQTGSVTLEIKGLAATADVTKITVRPDTSAAIVFNNEPSQTPEDGTHVTAYCDLVPASWERKRCCGKPEKCPPGLVVIGR